MDAKPEHLCPAAMVKAKDNDMYFADYCLWRIYA